MRWLTILGVATAIAGCGEVWNDPYPASERGKNILYSRVHGASEAPRPGAVLQRGRGYVHAQIYEPPLQYHYLKRPYELIPLTAESVPRPRYLDAEGNEVPAESPAVAFSEYEIRIKPGIRYQPHPAFARDPGGNPMYRGLTREDLARIWTLSDFKDTGTRELVADDYVYQIKRLAHPRLHSPIFGLMSEYIVGLKEFAATLQSEDKRRAAAGKRDTWLDLRSTRCPGVEVVDRYTYRVKLKGNYPQFAYWLAMPFFAPVPMGGRPLLRAAGHGGEEPHARLVPGGHRAVHADREQSRTRAWCSSATRTFAARPIRPRASRAMRRPGCSRMRASRMPFIDKVVFSREKEAIPYWNKFLQGYYDASSASARTPSTRRCGSRSKATRASRRRWRSEGITPADLGRHHDAIPRLQLARSGRRRRPRSARASCARRSRSPSTGRNSSRSSPTGAALPAQGPIPPGIFGYREGEDGMNPDRLRLGGRRAERKTDRGGEEAARRGRLPRRPRRADRRSRSCSTSTRPRADRATSRGSTGAASSSRRSRSSSRSATPTTTASRRRCARAPRRSSSSGWNADYPDPENFLFLLHGPQSRAKIQGENAANYVNPEFDRAVRAR